MADNVVEPKLTLLSGVPQQWEGGAGCFIVNGTMGGATVDFYLSDDANGTNFIAVGQQFSAVGVLVFAAPRNAWLKAVVAGGAPTLTLKVYRESGHHAFVQTQSGTSSGSGPSSDVNIASFGGAAITKGQKTMAGSIPVVLASDYAIATSAADMNEITGTISSAAVLSNFPVTTTAYHRVAIQFTTVTAGNTAVVEESNDNSTWTALTSVGGSAAVTAAGLHVYNFSAKLLRVRCSVYASGSVAITAEFRAYPIPFPTAYGAGAVDTRTPRTTLASDDPGVVSLAAILAKLNSSVAVTGTFWQATQPVSGTFWQATQPVSIATAPVLVAGSAIIGKVGIDQTTPGTTDSVTVAVAQGMGLNFGLKADAKNSATDTTSITAMSVWKQISFSIQAAAASLAGNIGVTGTFWQATQPVSIATAPVLVAGSAIIGKVGVDQTTPGTTDSVSVATGQGAGATIGVVSGAKVVTDANGTLQQYLRGLVVQLGSVLAATAATVSTSALYQGLRGSTANPTAVTDGQLVGAMADKLGRQVVVLGNVRDLKIDAQLTLTSTTSETTLQAAVALTFLDMYGLLVENISASACEVEFRDDTAGTLRFSIYVPAGDTRGFMLPSSDGYKQTTVNKNWTAKCITSVASIKISALFVKNI